MNVLVIIKGDLSMGKTIIDIAKDLEMPQESIDRLKEHYKKIENGICPLCNSDKGFFDQTVGEGTEFEISGTYCKNCDLEIV